MGRGLGLMVGVVLSLSSVLALVGPAVPAYAGTDPTWYLDCSSSTLGIYALLSSPPAIQAKCTPTSGSTVVSFQGSYPGLTFTVDGKTQSAVYFSATAAGTISGTWHLNDISTGKSISTGTFSQNAIVTSGSCSVLNVAIQSGTSNSGAVVSNGDKIRLNISYSVTGGGTFSLCSGGSTLSTTTDTLVRVSAAVPEFGLTALVPVALGFVLLRLRTRRVG